MIIVEDTRQQAHKHDLKQAYFSVHHIPVVRSKLIVGDYARLDNQTVSIDTKRDFVELAGNICGGQHERFRDECAYAQQCGIQLIVLVEEVPPFGDVALWQSPCTRKGVPYSHVKGATLKKAMATMTERYGVQFEFSSKQDSPRRIIEILEGVQ